MKILVKEYVFALLAAAMGIFAFWTWRGALPLIASGSFEQYGVFLVPAAFLIAAACLFSLAAIFIESRGIRYAGSALSVFAPVMFIPPNANMAGAFAAAALLAVFAGRRIHIEHTLSLGFSTSKILKAGLPIYFTAASLVVALLYYQEISAKDHLAVSIVPRAAVDLSLRFLSGAVSDLGGIPDANSLMTVDQFLSQNLEGQLKTQGVSLRALPQKEVAELVAQQRNELAKRYGIPVKGGERLADVLHRTITEKVEELLGPYARFLPFLSALTFFFALRALTFPLYFIVVALAALLIMLLRAVTIIKSEKRQIEVERLTL